MATQFTEGKKAKKGGFDCEFVKKPPEAFQSECPVCLLILREPYQAPCCGNSFCRVCIERIKTDNKPCPTCNERNFTTFHNKGLQRSLYGFQVYCSHKQEGCEWKGELGQLDNHLNLSPQSDKQLEGCDYSEIECIYCSELIKRSDIAHHQTEHCDKRPFSCEYCHDYESHYDDVINNHWPVCGYHPVRCPNECGTLPQRQDLENHVTKDCSKTAIACDFHHVGCGIKLPRKDMPAHLNTNLPMHMSLQLVHNSKILTSEIVTELQDKMKKLERDNEMLKSQLQDIHKENNHLQDTVVTLQKKVSLLSVDEKVVGCHSQLPELVIDLSKVEVGRCSQQCPPFYTHQKGYKMWFEIECHNYSGTNKAKYDPQSAIVYFEKTITLYLLPHIMVGEYDDHLHWPFSCNINVELLNKQDIESKLRGRRLQVSGNSSYSGSYTAQRFLSCNNYRDPSTLFKNSSGGLCVKHIYKWQEDASDKMKKDYNHRGKYGGQIIELNDSDQKRYGLSDCFTSLGITCRFQIVSIIADQQDA